MKAPPHQRLFLDTCGMDTTHREGPDLCIQSASGRRITAGDDTNGPTAGKMYGSRADVKFPDEILNEGQTKNA